MTDDVGLGEAAEGDAVDPFENIPGLKKPGLFFHRQIDLGNVSGDDGPGVKTDAGEEHFHLLPRGILRFVEDDKGVAQGSSAHEGQGRDLDYPLFDQVETLVRAKHVKEGIVQGAQIGIDLLGEVAGQKAEFLAGLDRRTGEDDRADLAADEGRNGHRHRQIGLAGAGRTDAEDDIVVADGVDIELLVRGLRRDHPVLGGDVDLVEKDLVQPGLGAGAEDSQAEGEIGAVDRVAFADKVIELVEEFCCNFDIMTKTGDIQAIAADIDLDTRAFLDNVQVPVQVAVQDTCSGIVREGEIQVDIWRWHDEGYLPAFFSSSSMSA